MVRVCYLDKYRWYYLTLYCIVGQFPGNGDWNLNQCNSSPVPVSQRSDNTNTMINCKYSYLLKKTGLIDIEHLVLGPDQNLVPIGVTKLYCDFQLDTYMRGLNMYDGLSRTVA